MSEFEQKPAETQQNKPLGSSISPDQEPTHSVAPSQNEVVEKPKATKATKAKAKKPARRRLTIKQQLFVKEYIASKGNGVKSAQKSYDVKNYETANAIAVENLHKPSIVDEIRRASDKCGFTLDKAINRLNLVVEQDKYTIPAVDLWSKLTGYQQKVAEINHNHNISLDENTLKLIEKAARQQVKVIDCT